MKSKRFVILWCVLAILGAFVVGVRPSDAHSGVGVVKSCKQGTDCTTNSANNALFAVCDPVPALPTGPCSHPNSDPDKRGPRPVTIQLSNFPANHTVTVWWLKGEVDDPTRSNCGQLLAAGRQSLGTASIGSNGKGSLNTSLPPGNHATNWLYGVNWICATTAVHSDGTNADAIGDQQFAIYPA